MRSLEVQKVVDSADAYRVHDVMEMAKARLDSSGRNFKNFWQNLMNGSLSGYKEDGTLAHKPLRLDCNFGGEESPMGIRQIVMDSYNHVIGDQLNPKLFPGNSLIADDLYGFRSATLAQLSRILVEAGVVVPERLPVDEEVVVGEVYRFQIERVRNMVAMCIGKTEGSRYRDWEDNPIDEGSPYFEFDASSLNSDMPILGEVLVGGADFSGHAPRWQVKGYDRRGGIVCVK